MKVIVKSKNINLKLYIPMFIFTSGVRFTKFINKFHLQNESLNKYIDYIDIDIIYMCNKRVKILQRINTN